MLSISVAMAVYNGERYLPEQLDSILSQLEEKDEIVVSYDESTDGSWKLLTQYSSRDRRVRVIKNPRPGINGNFDNAIRNCMNELIFLSDQDDVWDPNKRSAVLRTFEEQKADMVIHNGVHISETGEVISNPFFKIMRVGPGRIKNFVLPNYSGCCMAFTREIRGKILPIPDDIGGWDHWVGMAGECFGHVVFLDDVLIYHRLHKGNATPLKRRPLKVIARTRARLAWELACRAWRDRHHGTEKRA